MPYLRTLLPLAALSFAAFAAAQEAGAAGHGVEWMQNFADAKAKAKAENKDLLVDFTGSDWCVWCQRLDKEVFEQSEFQSNIGKDFVLVKLDFPRDKSLVTEAIAAQNAQLQQEYKVQGFPTIFLLDAAGRPYAQTGYQPGGATPYLEHLGDLQKARVARDEHFAKADGAEGVERAKHLAKGLEDIDTGVVLAHYRPIVDEIIELDADNAAGLKEHFGSMLARVEIEQQFQALAQEGKWDEVEAMVTAGLAKHAGKHDIEQLLTFYSAVVLLETKQDFAGALQVIDKAIAIAPDSEFGQRLPRVRKNIENMMKQMEAEGAGGSKGKDDGGI
ncbi:MAG: thioredoxin family protein [Planctomycetota bacterium]